MIPLNLNDFPVTSHPHGENNKANERPDFQGRTKGVSFFVLQFNVNTSPSNGFLVFAAPPSPSAARGWIGGSSKWYGQPPSRQINPVKAHRIYLSKWKIASDYYRI